MNKLIGIIGLLLCMPITVQTKDKAARHLSFTVENSNSMEVHIAMTNDTIPAKAKGEVTPMESTDSVKIEYKIIEVGQVDNEDLFTSIISRYRGHTLLVDFWATWCGPCRRANKEMLPMKEKLKNKGITYLYITGETSPQKTWIEMIPNIHGEHLRVTSDQWKYLISQFNIEGIPTYFVIDREGKTTYRITGFPGIDLMKSKLQEALVRD